MVFLVPFTTFLGSMLLVYLRNLVQHFLTLFHFLLETNSLILAFVSFEKSIRTLAETPSVRPKLYNWTVAIQMKLAPEGNDNEYV